MPDFPAFPLGLPAEKLYQEKCRLANLLLVWTPLFCKKFPEEPWKTCVIRQIQRCGMNRF